MNQREVALRNERGRKRSRTVQMESVNSLLASGGGGVLRCEDNDSAMPTLFQRPAPPQQFYRRLILRNR